jgi:hypothetical protein
MQDFDVANLSKGPSRENETCDARLVVFIGPAYAVELYGDVLTCPSGWVVVWVERNEADRAIGNDDRGVSGERRRRCVMFPSLLASPTVTTLLRLALFLLVCHGVRSLLG